MNLIKRDQGVSGVKGVARSSRHVLAKVIKGFSREIFNLAPNGVTVQDCNMQMRFLTHQEKRKHSLSLDKRIN